MEKTNTRSKIHSERALLLELQTYKIVTEILINLKQPAKKQMFCATSLSHTLILYLHEFCRLATDIDK